MPISKQELEFLMFLEKHPELSLELPKSLKSPKLKRFKNPRTPYKRILSKSRGLEGKIPDFVKKVEMVQLFLDQHDKSASPRSDARELLAEKALDAIPVDEFEDFMSRYRAKIRRKTAPPISGNARIVPDEKTCALFEDITSRLKWVRAFAYFADLIPKNSKIREDFTTGDLEDKKGKKIPVLTKYSGGMKKFLMAKNLVTRDGKLTPQGERVKRFFKDEITAKVQIKKRRTKPRG